MPDVRTLLRPVAVALLLAAGGLLLGPAPAAQAFTCGPRPTVKIPPRWASEEDRRWVVSTGPGYLEVVQPQVLPPDAVLFEGTAVDTGTLPPDVPPDGDVLWAGAPTWTFRVERVLLGDLPRQVVVVGAVPVQKCFNLYGAYQTGVGQRVAAVRDPDTGYLRGISGRWAAPTTDALPARSPLQWPAIPSGAAFGTWVVLVFLAEMAILSLATLAGVVYLRARELDLEERELALRDREAARLPPQG